jgi:sarcosine oxidase subunit gamma
MAEPTALGLRPPATSARRSPLAGRAHELAALPASVQARELAFLSQVNLRVDAAGPAADAVAKVLGVALPGTPCTSLRSGIYDVLWMGPDEWLVLAPDGTAEDLVGALGEALGDQHGAVTDVSAQRCAVTLEGPAAREVLAKGCSIDFHPRVAPSGTCVQTLLAQTGVVIVVRDDGAGDFLVLVRASFAQYFVDWLIDASAELS